MTGERARDDDGDGDEPVRAPKRCCRAETGQAETGQAETGQAETEETPALEKAKDIVTCLACMDPMQQTTRVCAWDHYMCNECLDAVKARGRTTCPTCNRGELPRHFVPTRIQPELYRNERIKCKHCEFEAPWYGGVKRLQDHQMYDCCEPTTPITCPSCDEILPGLDEWRMHAEQEHDASPECYVTLGKKRQIMVPCVDFSNKKVEQEASKTGYVSRLVTLFVVVNPLGAPLPEGCPGGVQVLVHHYTDGRVKVQLCAVGGKSEWALCKVQIAVQGRRKRLWPTAEGPLPSYSALPDRPDRWEDSLTLAPPYVPWYNAQRKVFFVNVELTPA